LLQLLRQRREEAQRASETARNGTARAVQLAFVEATNREIGSLEAAIGAAVTWVFADPEQAFLHHQLEALVHDLERFAGSRGTLAAMQARLHWTSTMLPATVDQRLEEWRSTAAAVAADDRYQRRRLALQPGLVPPGTFVAGASRQPDGPGYDAAARTEEGPPFAFAMEWFFVGKHELTRDQWLRLGGALEPLTIPATALGADAGVHPITGATWFQCTEILAQDGLVLPTELQWEYVARGGSTTPYWTGDDDASLAGAANFRDDDDDAGDPGTARADGYLLTAPALALRPNGFGLHSVASNAAEWCREPFLAEAYGRQGEIDPGDGELPGRAHNLRSVRGGSFATLPSAGRSAGRGRRAGNLAHYDIGVRVVRPVGP
jgi:formylglycine-generating enzyme required for sulfatase activity